MTPLKTLSIASTLLVAFTGAAMAGKTSMTCGPEDSPILQDEIQALEGQYDKRVSSTRDNGESFSVYSHKDPDSDKKAVVTRFADGRICLTPAMN